MARREIPIIVGFVTPFAPAPFGPISPQLPGQINPFNPLNLPQYGYNPYSQSIGFPYGGLYSPGTGYPYGGFTTLPFNNLTDPSATSNPYMQNYLGTLQGNLTPPTSGSGALAGSGMAQITNISFPPATAVGTSFPLQVSFVNNSNMPAQFSLYITAEQLGIDQVKTPPVAVQGHQQGLITQPFQFPTLAPPPGATNYVISLQLVHTDQNGSQIVDDSRSINIPAPSAAVGLPGEAIDPRTGQIVSPTGTLPSSPVPQGSIPVSTTGIPAPTSVMPLSTPISSVTPTGTPILAPATPTSTTTRTSTPTTTTTHGATTQPMSFPQISIPKINFSFPKGFYAGDLDQDNDGFKEGSCLEHNRKAFVHCEQEHGFVTVRGHNFCPGEDVSVHHHVVIHGHPHYEGNVLEDEDYTNADHTGRFIISLPIPSFLIGLFGDGIVSVRGQRSGRKARGTTSFR